MILFFKYFYCYNSHDSNDSNDYYYYVMGNCLPDRVSCL